MSEKDLIVALKQGLLNIDCVRMELVQNNQDKPAKYIGGGYIKQDENGVINFKIYANEVENSNELNMLVGTLSRKAGTVERENCNYSLIGKSYEGETWKAERILSDYVNVDWRQTPPCVYGKMHVIKCSKNIENKDGKHYLTMRFFDEIDIPCVDVTETMTEAGPENNRDTVRFSAANGAFHIQKFDNEIVVKVSSDAPFDQHFELSITEALRYVLARNIFYRVLKKSDGNEKTVHLFSVPHQSANPQLDGPLTPNCPDRFWRLFSCYLEYVIRERSLNDKCRCTRHLYTAVEASTNSYYAWAMGLCVAVEGIASLVNIEEKDKEKKDKDKKDKEKKDEVIAHINEWLESKCWTTTTVGKRTNGLIVQLYNYRLQDRLAPLVQNNIIDSSLLKAWTDLRHKGAHAAEIIDETDPDYQKLFDNLNKVTTLMYLVTFYLIGYKEGYTDYSTHGWPMKYVK